MSWTSIPIEDEEGWSLGVPKGRLGTQKYFTYPKEFSRKVDPKL